MELKCYFYLCAYQNNNKCTLNEVTINTAGLCENCIIPEIPKDIMKLLKDELIKRQELNSIRNYSKN